MGTTERKKREKERKKNLMLEAAEGLILEKGLDQLNMDEVAERAEFSKGTLYLYFSNKTELVIAICAKATGMLSTKVAKVLTNEATGLEMVYNIGAAFLTFVRSHPEYFKAMRYFENLAEGKGLSESEYIDQCRENVNSSFTSMVRAIQIGMQDGSINSNYDPKELAALLWSTSRGMVNMAYLHQASPHFNLMERHGIDVEPLFNNYMKLIGCGIMSDSEKYDYDSKSFYETNDDEIRNDQS